LVLTEDRDGWEIGSLPLSIDQFDLYRDGLELVISKPLCSSQEYYQSQSRLFERRLVEHRNSVFNEEDAQQKYVTSEVFRRVMPHYIDKQFNNGPFFLCHLDLHASNVIMNKNLEVEAFLDWEFASVLPIEVACAPPRCLTLDDVDGLRPSSEEFSKYAARLQIFINHVKSSPAVALTPPLSRDYILRRLNDALTKNEAFFAWSASDIRNMYPILWDHLALTTPILLDHESAQERGGVIFESEQGLVDAVLEKSNINEANAWVADRLEALVNYGIEKLSTCPSPMA
jgi:hypothetical protein